MKISFLSDTVYPYNKGGKETRSYELAQQLSKRGHEIYSVPITYEPRKGESKLAPIGDGLRISRMLIKNLRWKPK